MWMLILCLIVLKSKTINQGEMILTYLVEIFFLIVSFSKDSNFFKVKSFNCENRAERVLLKA